MKNPKYSPRTRRFIPDDVNLPIINIPEYNDPCPPNLSVDCKLWLCNNAFEGIVPDAGKFANPQTKVRDSDSNFNNGTSQKVSFVFIEGGFDAFQIGFN